MNQTPEIIRPDSRLPTPDDWSSIRKWRKAKRELLIRTRIGIGSAQRQRILPGMTSRISAILSNLPLGTIGFYWPIKGEFDLRQLIENSIKQGWQAALPAVINPGNPLEFRLWSPGMKLVRGIWNIPVPEERNIVTPTALLVPLVGFDPDGYRLGYGGGYYDRTIASFDNRPLTIGIGLQSCQLDTIYPQWHDIPMKQIVAISTAPSSPLYHHHFAKP